MAALIEIDDLLFGLARSNPILGVLSEVTLATLLREARRVDIAAEAELIRQGDQSDCAYFILEGELDVQVRSSFGDVTIARVSRGALIGEIGVFAGVPRNATVRAKKMVRALRFDGAALRTAGDIDPALLRSIISRLGTQIGRFNMAVGLYTNAVAALERDTFDLGILDELRQPAPELIDFAEHFRRMAAQIVERRTHEAEMASAAAIQRAMLPASDVSGLLADRFQISAYLAPTRTVGGDLYDIRELSGDRLAITIGDVCGKGVPAALFMAVTQTVMRLAIRKGENLKEEIRLANELLVANNSEDMFTTLFGCVLDLNSGVMIYSNCGQNPPVLLRRGTDRFELLRTCGPPLGILAATEYETRSITLGRGDLLFLYTDGVTEAEDRHGGQFGSKRLEHTLLQYATASAGQIVKAVVDEVVAFAGGAAQSDDITCIAVVRNTS